MRTLRKQVDVLADELQQQQDHEAELLSANDALHQRLEQFVNDKEQIVAGAQSEMDAMHADLRTAIAQQVAWKQRYEASQEQQAVCS